MKTLHRPVPHVHEIEYRLHEAVKAARTDRILALSCGCSPTTIQEIARDLRRRELRLLALIESEG
jgi:hypothetical protein